MNTLPKIKKPRILFVGLQKHFPDSDSEDFFTNAYFRDYDVVIVDPNGAFQGNTYTYTVLDDTLSLKRESGPKYLSQIREVTNNLVDYVNSGGIAIIFIRFMPNLVYETIDHHSRDQVTRNLNDFFPWKGQDIRKGYGRNIQHRDEKFMSDFWSATDGIWQYTAVLVKPSLNALSNVNGYPDDIVASFIATQESGFAFLTPAVNIDMGIFKDTPSEAKQFVDAVCALYFRIKSESPKPDLPDWAGRYLLPNEQQLQTEIWEANKKIEDLQTIVREKNDTIRKLRLHKLLFTGSDTALENLVDQVLGALGMVVQHGPKKRVDRIATYGDEILAVEIQGVKQAAKEDHVRSLIIWVQEVALKEKREPKGLLVANPFRDTLLKERPGKAWSPEAIDIADRNKLCLMTGLQLLGLYLDAKRNPDGKNEAIRRILDTNGIFEGYKDWNDFLTVADEDDSDPE